jgi:hypothetical protein
MIKTCKRCKEDIKVTGNNQKYCKPCAVTVGQDGARKYQQSPEAKAAAKKIRKAPKDKP